MSKVLVRVVLVAAFAAIAILAVVFTRGSVDLEAATVEFQFADDAVNPMWIRLDPQDDREREITISWGRLETTVVDDGSAERTYFFERGLGRPGPISVSLSEDAEVVFGSGLVESEEEVDLGEVVWDQVGPDRFAPEPVPATGDVLATASVEESYSWGLIVEGIGLRTTPEFDTDRTGQAVTHEDSFEIICWAEGDPITNGSDGEQADDATQFSTTLWWKIDGGETLGFISNAWFARVEDASELNVPAC